MTELDVFRGERRPAIFDAFGGVGRNFARMMDQMDRLLRPTDFDSDMLQVNMDVEETDNEYLVSLDIPGVRPEDVEVDIVGSTLSIRAERSKEEKTEGDGGRRRGTSHYYGYYQRSITLPEDIDRNNIEAQLDNGVLEVVLPKSRQERSRVKVKQGGGPSLEAGGQSSAGESMRGESSTASTSPEEPRQKKAG